MDPTRSRQLLLRLRAAAVEVVVAVAVATIGGGSTLIAILLTTQFRAWNRMVIFIGFLALLAVAWLLDDLGGWLRGKRWPRPVLVGLLGIVLFVGLWDQTTPSCGPDYKGLAGEYRADREYVRMIEARPASAWAAAIFISSLIVVARTSSAPRKMKGKPRTLLTWLG